MPAKSYLYAGLNKLQEEMSELGVEICKIRGRHMETGAVPDLELEASFVEEFGDVEAMLLYMRKRMPKRLRKRINDRRKMKVERHRERDLPGI